MLGLGSFSTPPCPSVGGYWLNQTKAVDRAAVLRRCDAWNLVYGDSRLGRKDWRMIREGGGARWRHNNTHRRTQTHTHPSG